MKEKVVIIDDDEDDAFFLKTAFEEIGIVSTIHTNVISALEHIRSLSERNLPQLIVTDCNMPLGDTINFIKFLKNHSTYSSIKVIAFTGGISNFEKENFQLAGVDRFVIKPFKMDEYSTCAKKFKEWALN